MENRPRLRDSKHLTTQTLYPLNVFPKDLINKIGGYLIGLDHNERVCFTWQPHGVQFTIHTEVPDEAIKFRVRKPPTLQKNEVLKEIEFNENWITIID